MHAPNFLETFETSKKSSSQLPKSILLATAYHHHSSYITTLIQTLISNFLLLFQFSLKMTFHVRTSSEPPLPHPLVLKLEEELHNLKASLRSISQRSLKAQILCNALKELGNLYKSIDDLLRLQSVLSHPYQKKRVEERMDGSIKLLDLTESTRHCMVLMREHIQDLQSVVLRKKGENAYAVSKKLERETKVCFKLLKQIDSSCFSTCLVKDWDLMMMEKMSMELREIVVVVFRSILSLFLVPRCKAKARRWGWGSASKEDTSECTKEHDQLIELEGSIEGLENGLEFLFKGLIQNRVSLLNFLSL